MLVDSNSFSSCFSSHGKVQKMPLNLLTTTYQIHLCNSPTLLTLTWCRTLSSLSLTLHIDSFSFSLSLTPPLSALSFFKTRPGFKALPPALLHHPCRRRTHNLYWDFTRAVFSPSSVEPISGFYLAVTDESRIEFLLGDLTDGLTRRSGTCPTHAWQVPTLLSRREHVFGDKTYVTTRAQLWGSTHEIEIEYSCEALLVKVDGSVSMVVKRLAWKFRGNERIRVGEREVEFYWDVYNWVCGSGRGHGVFMFQVGDGGVPSEMVGLEKKLMRKNCLTTLPRNQRVLKWSEESSCYSSSSSSSSHSSASFCHGFSLSLYVWNMV